MKFICHCNKLTIMGSQCLWTNFVYRHLIHLLKLDFSRIEDWLWAVDVLHDPIVKWTDKGWVSLCRGNARIEMKIHSCPGVVQCTKVYLTSLLLQGWNTHGLLLPFYRKRCKDSKNTYPLQELSFGECSRPMKIPFPFQIALQLLWRMITSYISHPLPLSWSGHRNG